MENNGNKKRLDVNIGESVIRQLYDGEICPGEDIQPKDPEFKELLHTLTDEKDYFMSLLAADDLNRFKKLDEAYLAIMSVFNYENFNYGFRLGVKLITESLINGGEQINESNGDDA